MIDLSTLNPKRKKRLSSLLGLAIDGSRLEGVVVRRTNGSLQIQQSFSVTLSLDPLTADPELVGREIRNHLDAAEVREKNCIVGLPLRWALTTHAEVPELPEEDVASFLQIEAERGFAADVETLRFAASRCRFGAGKQQALLVGIPRAHVSRLEEALRAAKLKPTSFSLGIAALQPPGLGLSDGVMALRIGETHVGLQVNCGAGVAALRALEGALETEGGRRVLHADLVAREARITLGQLPAELRDSVNRVRIFGPRDLSQQLADEMELRLEALGLKSEIVTRYGANEFGLQLPVDAVVSQSLSLAAGCLAGRKAPFEFLPPRVTAWQHAVKRYSSGKLRTAGMAAAAVLFVLFSAFGFQQWQLGSLQSEWTAIAPKAKDLEALNQQIRQYRPWYDESFRGLSILKQLTTAFPEDGVVTARTVEIRDLNAVTCTGTTRDNQSLLKVLEKLRAGGNAAGLRLDSIRGSKPPMQFTFGFRWSEGGSGEN